MPLLRYKTQLTQAEHQYLQNPSVGNFGLREIQWAPRGGGSTMKRSIRNLWRETQGQDLVEYALAAGMVAVAAVASMPPLSGILSNVFNAIGGMIQNSVP